MPFPSRPNQAVFVLPPPEDLARLDPLDREYLLTKFQLERRRRLKANIDKARALPDPPEWMETNCRNPSKVSPLAEDTAGAELIRLEDFQKRITRRILTINPKTGRFPYRTVVYSAPKKSGKTTFGA